MCLKLRLILFSSPATSYYSLAGDHFPFRFLPNSDHRPSLVRKKTTVPPALPISLAFNPHNSNLAQAV